MSFPQTTPVRPVPGAFLNTPAVASRFQSGSDSVRRQLFTGNDSNQAVSHKSSAPVSSSRSVAATAPSAPRTASNDSLIVPTALPPLRTENVPPVVKAARAINACLQSDGRYPDLDSYCRRRFKSLDAKESANKHQRARHPTTTLKIPILRWPPSTKLRCTPFRTKSSTITMLASFRL
jgi:nuclear pore complex protein Nup155